MMDDDEQQQQLLLKRLQDLVLLDIDNEGEQPPHSNIIYAFRNERLLVAWVLLSSRVSSSQGALDQAWEKYGTVLSSFAERVLLVRRIVDTNNTNNDGIIDDDEDDEENSEQQQQQTRLQICYLRLVAQVVARLGLGQQQQQSSSSKQQLQKLPQRHLMQELLQAWVLVSSHKWKQHCTPSIHHHELNVDVGNALLVTLGREETTTTIISKSLNMVWQVFSSQQQQQQTQTPQGTTQKMNPPNKKLDTTEEEEKILLQLQPPLTTTTATTTNNDTEQMIALLESTLLSSNSCDDDDDDETWMRLVLVLFNMYSTAVSDALASKVIRWISSQQQQHVDHLSKEELKFEWHEWVLRYVTLQCSSQHDGPFLALLQDRNVMDILQKILVSHVISPEESALRAPAWHAISAVVQKMGWKKWGTAAAAAAGRSSISAPICLWSRLASGEWKIQLEKEAAAAEEDSHHDNKAILDGCGTILISVIHFLVNFDEHPDEPMPLGPDALLHIRESLEGCFMVTSEFLRAQRTLNYYEPIVARVWYQLLPELELDAIPSLETAMAALSELLHNHPCLDDDFSREAVLRSLLHIQNTAEEDDNVRELIKPMEKLIADMEHSIASYSTPNPSIAQQSTLSDSERDLDHTHNIARKSFQKAQENLLVPNQDDRSGAAVRSRDSVKEKWATRRKQREGTPNSQAKRGLPIENPGNLATTAVLPLCVLLRQSWNNGLRNLRNSQRQEQPVLMDDKGDDGKGNHKKTTFPSVMSILQASALNNQIEAMQGEGDDALSLYPSDFDSLTTLTRMAESRSRAFLLLDFSSIVQIHTTWRKRMPKKGVQFAYAARHNANGKLLALLVRLGVALKVGTKYDLRLARLVTQGQGALLEDFHVTEKPPSFYRAIIDEQKSSQHIVPIAIRTLSDIERLHSQMLAVSCRRKQKVPQLRFLLKLESSNTRDWLTILQTLCKEASSMGHGVIGVTVELENEDDLAVKLLLDNVSDLIDFAVRKKCMPPPEVHLTLYGTETNVCDTAVEWCRSEYSKCTLISVDISRLLLANSAALCARIIGVKKSGTSHTHYYIDDGCYGSLSNYSKDAIPIPLQPHADRLAAHTEPGKQSPSTVWGPTCDGLDKVCSNVQLPISLTRDDWLVFSDFGVCNEGTCFNGLSPPDIACCILGNTS